MEETKIITKTELEQELFDQEALSAIDLNAYVLALAAVIIEKTGVTEDDINEVREVMADRLKKQFIDEATEQLKADGYTIIED